MDKTEIKEKIIQYFKSKYQDKIDMENIPEDGGLMAFLGTDSLQSLEILIDMESQFGIEITDDLLSFQLVDNINHMTDKFSDLLCASK